MYYDQILMLLQSLCLNYPLLVAWGYTLNVPVGLVFSEKNEIYPYIQYLSGTPKVLKVSDRLEVIEKTLQNANSDGVFFIMPDICKYKVGNNMDKINMILNSVNIFGREEWSKAAVFMVFHKFIPSEYKDQVFEIHISENRNTDSKVDVFEWVPESEQLEVVKDKIVNMKITDTKSRAFYAASAFLYPKLPRLVYEDIVETVKEMVRLADSYCMDDGMEDFLVDLFYIPFMKHEIEILKLPGLHKADISKLKSAAFTRENSLYISEELFRKIFAPAIEQAGSNQIKLCLSRNGILTTNQRDLNYTSTMNYYIDDNNRHWTRARMLKFDLNKIPTRDGMKFEYLL